MPRHERGRAIGHCDEHAVHQHHDDREYHEVPEHDRPIPAAQQQPPHRVHVWRQWAVEVRLVAVEHASFGDAPCDVYCPPEPAEHIADATPDHREQRDANAEQKRRRGVAEPCRLRQCNGSSRRVRLDL
jgi:hypothetical protein